MKSLLGVCGMTLFALTTLAGLTAWPTAARAAADGEEAKPAEERPMPKHFDELNLTDEQKQKTWDTLDAYNAKIQQIQRLGMASRLSSGGFATGMDTAFLLKLIQKKRALALRAILTEEQLTKLDALHAADVAPKP